MNRSHEARLERESAGYVRRGATPRALRPCAGLRGYPAGAAPRHSRYGHKLLPEHGPGIHSQLSRWGEGGLGCQYHRAHRGQSRACTLTACLPARSAQPSGRRGALGAGASSGPGSSPAGNFLCGLQTPSSVWVAEMGTTRHAV